MAGPTSRSCWQDRERKAAAVFGAKRTPGSGSMGRSDLTRSDSTHPDIFLEGKLRASDYATKLYDATKKLAKRENKIPVVAISVKGRPGHLIVIDPHDLPALAAAYEAARVAEAQANQEPATFPIDQKEIA